MNSIANKARRLLINIGKILPFCFCFVLFVAYSECMIAIATENYLDFNGYIILNTPMSFYIAQYFMEYDIAAVAVIYVLSVAVETCYWNKLAILYIALHLAFKHIVQDLVLNQTDVILLSTVNIIISAFFCYKGMKILIFKH